MPRSQSKMASTENVPTNTDPANKPAKDDGGKSTGAPCAPEDPTQDCASLLETGNSLSPVSEVRGAGLDTHHLQVHKTLHGATPEYESHSNLVTSNEPLPTNNSSAGNILSANKEKSSASKIGEDNKISDGVATPIEVDQEVRNGYQGQHDDPTVPNTTVNLPPPSVLQANVNNLKTLSSPYPEGSKAARWENPTPRRSERLRALVQVKQTTPTPLLTPEGASPSSSTLDAGDCRAARVIKPMPTRRSERIRASNQTKMITPTPALITVSPISDPYPDSSKAARLVKPIPNPKRVRSNLQGSGRRPTQQTRSKAVGTITATQPAIATPGPNINGTAIPPAREGVKPMSSYFPPTSMIMGKGIVAIVKARTASLSRKRSRKVMENDEVEKGNKKRRIKVEENDEGESKVTTQGYFRRVVHAGEDEL